MGDSTTVIDYSEVWFVRIRRGGLPDTRRGKFVQLRHPEDGEFVVFSPLELSTYHANIVERFLTPRQVAGDYETAERDVWSVYDQAWDIVGGGHFVLDAGAPSLRLYGRSLAYGRFDAEGLVARLSPAFDGYAIRIE